MERLYFADMFSENQFAEEIAMRYFGVYHNEFLRGVKPEDAKVLPLQPKDFIKAWDAFGSYEAPQVTTKNLIALVELQLFFSLLV